MMEESAMKSSTRPTVKSWVNQTRAVMRVLPVLEITQKLAPSRQLRKETTRMIPVFATLAICLASD